MTNENENEKDIDLNEKDDAEIVDSSLEDETEVSTDEVVEEVSDENESENLNQETDETIDVDELNEQILDLKQQLKDEEVRSLANIQNIQRRHKLELEDAHKYAATKFAREMLPIRDYLEMALLDESNNFEAIKTGVELTLKQLNSAFDHASIAEINPLGELLDPNKHNAVSTEPSDEQSNTVVKVLQKGYEMNGRVLRPAMVVVAVAQQ